MYWALDTSRTRGYLWDIVVEPVLPLLLFFRWCKVLKATRILFVMRWLDMKVLWDSVTNLGRHFFRRFVMVLEMSL